MHTFKIGEKFNFSEKCINSQIIELVQKSLEIFSRSRMTKRTSLLDSSREIKLPKKNLSNSETIGFFHDFRSNGRLVTHMDEIFMRILGFRK